MLNSGGRYVQEVEVLFTSMDKVVDKAINYRKALSINVPTLLWEENLKKFGSQLDRMIDGGVSGYRSTIGSSLQADNPSADTALLRIAELKTLTLKAKIARELLALPLEVQLGMYQKEETSMKSTINISNSTIANLNLGTVVGDLNA